MCAIVIEMLATESAEYLDNVQYPRPESQGRQSQSVSKGSQKAMHLYSVWLLTSTTVTAWWKFETSTHTNGEQNYKKTAVIKCLCSWATICRYACIEAQCDVGSVAKYTDFSVQIDW